MKIKTKLIQGVELFILISALMIGGTLFFCGARNHPLDDNEIPGTNPLPQSQHLTNDVNVSRHNAITQAIEKASPAVVGINITQIRRYRQYSIFEDDPFWGHFFQPREYQQKVKSLGSGFLISSDGMILTNEHVVEQAEEIIVTMTDGTQFQAEKIGEDKTYDVALLKIEGDHFPFIPLGDSDDIIIGEWAIALGNPFGLFDINSKPTVTVGVISATDMDFQNQIEGRSYNEMIQTDAAINGGNSGGPLVNSLGQCIGINAFIISGSSYQKTSIGIGFAIPINRVKKILPDLKTYGTVERSFHTGLQVENLTWVSAQMLGISPRDGVLVSKVEKGSPSEMAGVKEGDVIVAINKTRVRSVSDAQLVINQVDITESADLELKVYRDKKLLDKTIRLTR